MPSIPETLPAQSTPAGQATSTPRAARRRSNASSTTPQAQNPFGALLEDSPPSGGDHPSQNEGGDSNLPTQEHHVSTSDSVVTAINQEIATLHSHSDEIDAEIQRLESQRKGLEKRVRHRKTAQLFGNVGKVFLERLHEAVNLTYGRYLQQWNKMGSMLPRKLQILRERSKTRNCTKLGVDLGTLFDASEGIGKYLQLRNWYLHFIDATRSEVVLDSILSHCGAELENQTTRRAILDEIIRNNAGLGNKPSVQHPEESIASPLNRVRRGG